MPKLSMHPNFVHAQGGLTVKKSPEQREGAVQRRRDAGGGRLVYSTVGLSPKGTLNLLLLCTEDAQVSRPSALVSESEEGSGAALEWTPHVGTGGPWSLWPWLRSGHG